MPVTRAITNMLAVLVENDYRSKGLTLADLGLQGRTKAEIVKFWKAGVEQNFKALDSDLGCFWGLWV